LPAAGDHHADIVIVPIAPDHGWAEGSETCVAVFVTAGNGGVDVDRALLSTLYGLTPTEATVAATLSRGDGLPSAAKALGMQVSTARTHLHRIFDKTGTQRQTQLVWLLKSLPQ
jgi:DNA-binding CsgD family transcriptional regulator